MGVPLLGDELYGGTKSMVLSLLRPRTPISLHSKIVKMVSRLDRPCLHAWTLGWELFKPCFSSFCITNLIRCGVAYCFVGFSIPIQGSRCIFHANPLQTSLRFWASFVELVVRPFLSQSVKFMTRALYSYSVSRFWFLIKLLRNTFFHIYGLVKRKSICAHLSVYTFFQVEVLSSFFALFF